MSVLTHGKPVLECMYCMYCMMLLMVCEHGHVRLSLCCLLVPACTHSKFCMCCPIISVSLCEAELCTSPLPNTLGQTCICANRVFVANAIYDKFAELVAERVAALKLGDGLEAGEAW